MNISRSVEWNGYWQLTWLLEAQAWKLLSIKYVLMAPELTIHNPDHLRLIMQEWADHLVEMDDEALQQMCAWIDRSRLEGEWGKP